MLKVVRFLLLNSVRTVGPQYSGFRLVSIPTFMSARLKLGVLSSLINLNQKNINTQFLILIYFQIHSNILFTLLSITVALVT
jgi:hypothetical protein